MTAKWRMSRPCGASQSRLWIPPTLPYWPLEGAWKNNEGFSKKLLFSAWNVVPDVVVSNEAERRMVGEEIDVDYRQLHDKQTPLLRYDMRERRPANMSTLVLALPCLPLADEIAPLALALQGQPVRQAVQDLRRLKRSLAIYRVVFGQPRQEELLELLESSDIDRRALEGWAVRLEPGDL